MLRIRFKRNYKENKKGDIVEVSNNEAFGLVESGVAQITNESVSVGFENIYQDKIIIGESTTTYKTKGS